MREQGDGLTEFQKRVQSRKAAFMFAAWDVERWAREHDNRIPSEEELQQEPFNYTLEFAQQFFAHALALGWIVEESEPAGGRGQA